MSSRSSVFYCSVKFSESLHIYHEGNTGKFRIEIETMDSDGTMTLINMPLSQELKDAFIKSAIAYPKDA